MFALVDCNSFYCSCERVFNPKLRNQPVIALSNNDGVTISRTDEAKALGIKMGDPYHKIQYLIKKHNIYVYSSNYTLYGDMSARVMKILSQFTPEIEIYSIDEAFLNLAGMNAFESYGLKIAKTVQQWTGIPVGVGIGPTKVLAKVANKIAKGQKHISPVFDISARDTQEYILRTFPVEDIWGIGHRSAEKLKNLGIHTAKDLRDADLDDIQKVLTIVGRKIALELRGFSCLALELVAENKKQIISSRSFGRPIFKLDELKEAVSHYVSRAAEKLRSQNSVCGHLQVFVHTNPFKQVTQYYNSTSVKIMTPTSTTSSLIKAAFVGLEKIFQDGIEYKKAGVMLSDLRQPDKIQFSLYDDAGIYFRDAELMKVVDKINHTFGSNTLQVAACGTKPLWAMRSNLRSPCYTTRWSDLLQINGRDR